MTLSVLMTCGEKPPETVQAVLRSLRGQAFDELILVADRSPQSLADVMKSECMEIARLEPGLGRRMGIVHLNGNEGWRTPSVAFNAGLEHVTGDIVVINHGDVEQDDRSLDRVRALMAEREAVYFGKVLESKPEMCNGPGSAGPVLMASYNPRALTYLVAMPTRVLRAAGGWSEAFMSGVWYEDDDLMARVWKTSGLPFVFDDRFSGTHHSHVRGYMDPAAIQRNAVEMQKAHGTRTYFPMLFATGMMEQKREHGRTVWTRTR